MTKARKLSIGSQRLTIWNKKETFCSHRFWKLSGRISCLKWLLPDSKHRWANLRPWFRVVRWMSSMSRGKHSWRSPSSPSIFLLIPCEEASRRWRRRMRTGLARCKGVRKRRRLTHRTLEHRLAIWLEGLLAWAWVYSQMARQELRPEAHRADTDTSQQRTWSFKSSWTWSGGPRCHEKIKKLKLRITFKFLRPITMTAFVNWRIY